MFASDETGKIYVINVHEEKDIEVLYLKANDVESRRRIQPLEMGEMYYGEYPFFGITAICRLRGEERNFRVDRILEMKVVE